MTTEGQDQSTGHNTVPGTQPNKWQMHRHDENAKLPKSMLDQKKWITFAVSDADKGNKQPAVIGQDGKPIIKKDGKPVGLDATNPDNHMPYNKSRTGFVPCDDWVVVDYDRPFNAGFQPQQNEWLRRLREVTYTEKSFSNVRRGQHRHHAVVRAKGVTDLLKCDYLGIEIIAAGKKSVLMTGVAVNECEVTEQQELVDELIAEIHRQKNSQTEQARAGATVKATSSTPARPKVVHLPGVKQPTATSAPTKKVVIHEKQGRHLLVRDLMWKLIKNNVQPDVIEAVMTKIDQEHCNPPKGEKILSRLLAYSLKRDETDRGEVQRINRVYVPSKDSQLEALNVFAGLEYELRYNQLSLTYEMRRKGEKTWVDAFGEEEFVELQVEIGSRLVTYPRVEESPNPNKLFKLVGGELRAGGCQEASCKRMIKFAGVARSENPFKLALERLRKWGEEHHPNLTIQNVKRKQKSPKLVETFFTVGERYQKVARFVVPAMMRVMIYRSLKPGYKFDLVPILQGDEGLGKSAFGKMLLKALGDDNLDWFTDQFGLDEKNKEQVENAIGHKLIELSEMAGMAEGKTDKMKALVTRPIDKARLAYRHNRVDVPRQFVLFGTINPYYFLKIAADDKPRRWATIGVKLLKTCKNGVKTVELMQKKVNFIKLCWYEQLLLSDIKTPTYTPHELEQVIIDNALEHRIRKNEAWEAEIESFCAEKDQFSTKMLTKHLGLQKGGLRGIGYGELLRGQGFEECKIGGDRGWRRRTFNAKCPTKCPT